MNKIGAMAVLLASMGLLAACEKEPENNMDSVAETIEEAAEDSGEAIEEKAREITGNERTTGEKMADGMESAGESIGEAYDDSADYVKEKASQAGDAMDPDE
ncbi:hypothetical protein [Halopseudomonas sp.]|uniref:hypothetical protein n=1 Tax=Halopseudomonas sp. TaxID=2901191 RepID=UPI00356169B3